MGRKTSLSESKSETTRELTFLLYLVVVPTASVPFLIALAVRWFRTTWLGMGRMELSSGVAVPEERQQRRNGGREEK